MRSNRTVTDLLGAQGLCLEKLPVTRMGFDRYDTGTSPQRHESLGHAEVLRGCGRAGTLLFPASTVDRPSHMDSV